MSVLRPLLATLAMLAFASMGVAHADPAANQRSALAFYDALIVSKKGAAAARPYLAEQFVTHSPSFAERGPDAFLAPAEEAARNPASEIAQWNVEVLRSVSDGDLVFLHARGSVREKLYAIVDIFRFENGKIVEHWDVIQDVTNARNPDGAF